MATRFQEVPCIEQDVPTIESIPPPLPRGLLSICFLLLGLLNNASYVIMIAGAKHISEGGTALVFLANVLPSLLVKLSAPYWFDKVAYSIRLVLATFCMLVSFGLVASANSVQWQLVGVALTSLQCGLGEASLLALAGKFDALLISESTVQHMHHLQEGVPIDPKGFCLTSFSSGTGLAGVFGFFWKFVFTDWLNWSFSATLWAATSLAVLYWYASYSLLSIQDDTEGVDARDIVVQGTELQCNELSSETQALNGRDSINTSEYVPDDETDLSPIAMAVSDMDGCQRFGLVRSLWPYMIPLFLVYVAEYALQAGTWTAIGFPMDDRQARDRFYEYSNWMYQAGVFASRSSGTIFTVPMSILWLMPMLQVANVFIFGWIATEHSPSFLYSQNPLLPLCFYVGLLGGAVYVHGYKRICADLPKPHQEFALAATGVAEGAGILIADLLGLIIQGCLYKWNDLDGALVTCPWGN